VEEGGAVSSFGAAQPIPSVVESRGTSSVVCLAGGCILVANEHRGREATVFNTSFGVLTVRDFTYFLFVLGLWLGIHSNAISPHNVWNSDELANERPFSL
jgi:hypothetical protein